MDVVRLLTSSATVRCILTLIGKSGPGPCQVREPLHSRWPGGPHEGRRWEARASGRTYRFAIASLNLKIDGRHGDFSHQLGRVLNCMQGAFLRKGVV